MFKTVRLLNRSWFMIILERSYVFSLQAVENDLSSAALVAGFTKFSLHKVLGWVALINSVYLSARLSLPVTMVTFELTIFCYFWLRYFCEITFLFDLFLFLQNVGGMWLKNPSAPPSFRSLDYLGARDT